jgi:leucyl/phenylalanyl-tRNA---protein transferase
MDAMSNPGAAAELPQETEPRFHETWTERLRRWGLGVLYALKPSRIALLPRIWLMTLVYYLTPRPERDWLPAFPRFYSERGLVGISEDLSVPSLIESYARGFFPVCHIGPMKWWCPEERAVLDPAETHVSHNVRRLLRKHKFTVTMDRDFAGVMEACARPRDGKVPLTWITPQIMRAFWQAHKAGYAHSVEVWDEDGNLVGGLYGLAIGKVYFGESKFSRVRDASKVGTAYLHRHLAAWGYRLCDAKWMTPHLETFGFYPMPRDQFLSLLPWYMEGAEPVGHWRIDPSLDPADWPREPDDGPAPVSKPRRVA